MNELFFAQMFGRDWIIRNGIYVPIVARPFGLHTNTDSSTIGTMKFLGQEGPWAFVRPAMPELIEGPFGILIPKRPMVREYPATEDLCSGSFDSAIKNLNDGVGFRRNSPIPKDVVELLKPPPPAWHFVRPSNHLSEMVFKLNPLCFPWDTVDDRKTFSEAMMRAQAFDRSKDHLIEIIDSYLKILVLEIMIKQQLKRIDALMEKEIRRIERASRVGRLIWLGIKLLAGWD